MCYSCESRNDRKKSDYPATKVLLMGQLKRIQTKYFFKLNDENIVFKKKVCRSGVPNLQFGNIALRCFSQVFLPNCKFGTPDIFFARGFPQK
ncbi:Uncharacterized protein dnm_085690 [Desulfonema magnum]|uniref:Uncharacterized protein n=1 Tax=Desulfonema magnum TaxID=45655 RepID=A0A975GSX5_9BACT|nr:Uncharacterized protein dnm_085690 [Desulfonema magnum]